MSQYSHEMRRRAERRSHPQPRTAEESRRALARDILARIQEHLAEDPDIAEFDTSLNMRIGRLETYLLRHQRSEVIAKIAINRVITAEFDENAKPPSLHIMLGETIPDEE